MKLLDSKQGDINWGQGTSLPLQEVEGEMNKRFLKRGAPKVPLSEHNRNKRPGLLGGSPIVQQGHPTFSKRVKGKLRVRDKITSPRPQSAPPSSSGSPTVRPHPQLPQ